MIRRLFFPVLLIAALVRSEIEWRRTRKYLNDIRGAGL